MNQRFYQLISGLLAVILIAVIAYFAFSKKTEEVTVPTNNTKITTPTPLPKTTGVEYKNTEYGFSFILPESWKDFFVIEDIWEGYNLDAKGKSQILTRTGPFISIRHPDWEYKSPRQDIPIMVFTIVQWTDLQANKFHIGVAPINPTELGRNKKYVFVIPARYNYEYLTGYEEVEEILGGKPFKAQ